VDAADAQPVSSDPGDDLPTESPAVAGSAVFPSDPADGWEPGAPSIRALLPSAVAGAVIPIAVYNSVRPHVGGDAAALIIAGIPAAAWVLFEWVRKRTVDPIGVVVLLGFALGIAASYALGGNTFVLKARDSAFTFLFGVASLGSLWLLPRPLMFYFGRSFSAGDVPSRVAVYDQLWDMPPARAVFRCITLMWGIGLIGDAGARVLLAAYLPTGTFVVVSPLVAAVFIGTMFAATIVIIRWSRQLHGDAVVVDAPDGGGSTWWWTRRYFAPALLGRLRRGGGAAGGASL